jgi:PAS domain S-box-containing protein
MRPRKTLLFPIIALFVVVALTTLLIGYWISLSNLQRSLAAREEDRVTGIHSITKAIIDTEIARLSAVSRLLSRNRTLADALSTYSTSKNKASLKKLMDDLYEGLGIDYLVVTDPKGINLYSSKDAESRTDLTEMWGMDEALEGKEIATSDRGPGGFVMSFIGPVYQGNNLKGTVIAGIKIDNEFAGRLAADTGSKIFFGTALGVIAGSTPTLQASPIDKDLVKHSLLDKKPTIIFDRERETTRLYAPIAVVDTHFCLVVDTDASRMYLLLRQSKSRLLLASAGVLLFVVVIASIMAGRLIRPLRSLRKRAESLILDYSGEVQAERSQGDEVDTLVRAFDRMVDTVRGHVAATDSTNERLEEAREELESRVKERTAEITRTNEELILAEAAARENERWLQTVLESLQTGIMLVDACTHQIVYANAAARTLTGLAEEDLVGSVCHRHVCPAEVGRCPISDLGQMVDNTERILLAADGSQIPVIKSVVPVRFKGRDLLLESFIDIRGRKSLEEAMKVAKDTAEAANRAKSQFLARMSHEIRTPMNGVMGMADLLLATQLTDKQRRCADTIQLSGQTLLNVINDILDFSKIEAGKVELVRAAFSVRQVVEEVAEMLAARAQGKGIELGCLVRSDVPNDLVGDPHHLRQILLNLMGNAVKFTEVGEVAVKVSMAEEFRDAARLRFEVADTGIGVPPSEQESIFNSFSQGDSSMNRKYGGTGLGLAIAKQLVKMMKGEIGVEGTVGKGSTFWFTIVLDRQPLSERLKSQPRRDLTGLHVLVVDDNATYRAILEHYAANWGMRSESAENAPRALELLHRAAGQGEPYDVAILDMMLPGMNGRELARVIKTDPAIADTRLVMLSCAESPDCPESEQEACIAAYLTKPVRQSMLFDCLANVMSGGASRVSAEVGAKPSSVESHGTIHARILLVEDNEVNQMVGRAMLENIGCQVDVASNGVKAVDALHRQRYDLVFMDCQMPEMDGYEATRTVRERERQGNGSAYHTPIIALTAHAMEGAREPCLAAGMDDYLSKPFNEGQLRKVLTQWVPSENSQAGRELERGK